MIMGENGLKLLYFIVNLNGEVEVVIVQFIQGSWVCNKVFDYDFSELEIKG